MKLMMDDLAKILALLERNIRVAFAVAFAGIVGIALAPDAFYVLVIPTLLAVGFIFVQVVIWAWRGAAWLASAIHGRWNRWNVLSRVDALRREDLTFHRDPYSPAVDQQAN